MKIIKRKSATRGINDPFVGFFIKSSIAELLILDSLAKGLSLSHYMRLVCSHYITQNNINAYKSINSLVDSLRNNDNDNLQDLPNELTKYGLSKESIALITKKLEDGKKKNK